METILARITKKKQLLDAHQPLNPMLTKNLYAWSRIALTYSSNAIEGNTLTSNETAQVVEKGITIGGKTFVEHQEAINHAKAVDFIQQLSTQKKLADLTVGDILAIHRIILDGINAPYAGVLRDIAVRISGSMVTRPNYLKVPELMDQFVAHVTTDTQHPALVAADAHLQFVLIHPFVDGNGRTARLLLNLILLMHDYPLTIIENTVRQAYIDGIEQALLHDQRAGYYQVVCTAIEQGLDRYLDAISESAPRTK